MFIVTDLTKNYGKKSVIDNVSFTVPDGAVTGFLGPNGSGKSTTMRCMLGLDRPTSGTALVNGRPFTSCRTPARQVGAMLDATWMNPKLSARTHLRSIARGSAVSTARADECLEIVGLGDVGKQRLGGFSLGMKQRLGLATALLGDPSHLVLDEPVNGLDPDGIRWIREMIRRLADEGRAVLVSSHLLAEMEMMADRLAIIGKGRLVGEWDKADLMEGHANLEEAYWAVASTHTEYNAVA